MRCIESRIHQSNALRKTKNAGVTGHMSLSLWYENIELIDKIDTMVQSEGRQDQKTKRRKRMREKSMQLWVSASRK